MLKKGVLRAWDNVNWKADVELAGSTRHRLLAIPVARNIASAEMTTGRNVAVAFFDESSPADAVVVAVYI
jgi:hypothetical protein